MYQALQDLPAGKRELFIPHNLLVVDWNPYDVTLSLLQWLEATQGGWNTKTV